MKKFLIGSLALALLALVFNLTFTPVGAQVTGEQALLRMRFLYEPTRTVNALGQHTLSVGEISNLSAEVTNTTITQVVAAPAAGSIYVRGIIVTKSVAGTGAVTLTYGTGTNCGTGTTTWLVISGATSNSLLPGYITIGAALPAAKALCLSTEAAGTGVRALTL